MPDRNEITLRVDLPDVTETPYRVEVRCGETTVSVYEHGVQGSGSWAVWIGSGYTVGNEGEKYHPSIEQAVAAAREYVRDKERSRLLHAQLSATLAGGAVVR